MTPKASPPGFASHPPQWTEFPMSGYELLAAVQSGHSGGQRPSTLRPVYRRFETLNHRMLLHLQDELSELEGQLRQIDVAATAQRKTPNGIFPEARRIDNITNGDVTRRKMEILGGVGFKLEQYSEFLSIP